MKQELATVAIIGRPNTGKSTLFNTYIGERKAIESDIAGTTRDCLIEKISAEFFDFFLVDTAGLTDGKGDSLEEEIQRQAEISMENADIILFLVDARAPLTQDDYELADRLRKSPKPVIFAANKLDDGDENPTYQLAELGLGVPLAISGKNYFGIQPLTEAIQNQLSALNFLPRTEQTPSENEDIINISFIGRPNVGKSSLMNKLLGQDRSVVSEVAGTTRDTIDSPIWWHKDTNNFGFEIEPSHENKEFLLLDTAGMRRRGKVAKDFEFWSVVRSTQAIERSDVCCLLIDALDGVTHQDLVIAGKVIDAGKGLVLCVNKFDLVREKSQAGEETDERELDGVKMWDERLDKIRENYIHYLSNKIKFLNWAPVVFFSAKTGKGIGDIFPNAIGIQTERHKRISTAEMNRFIPEIYYGSVQPSVGTKLGKIKYASQVDSAPPKFVFHVNNKDAFHLTYRRYVENQIRAKFGFHGTPIRVDFRDAMEDFKGGKKRK